MTIAALDLAHRFFGSKPILILSLSERKRATLQRALCDCMVRLFPVGLWSLKIKCTQAVRPRPRGQALGHTPAREDAGAPLRRHWMHLIFNDHQPTVGVKCFYRRVSDD